MVDAVEVGEPQGCALISGRSADETGCIAHVAVFGHALMPTREPQ